MAYLKKEDLLAVNDLDERDVELPGIGTVRVRGLSALYSNEASSKAMVYKQVGRDNVATIDTGKLEVLQAFHGLVDPKLDSVEEAEQFARRCGPTFRKVVDAIGELSDLGDEDVEAAEARFQNGGTSANGAAVGEGHSAGGSGPDVPSRTGAGVQDASGGAR